MIDLGRLLLRTGLGLGVVLCILSLLQIGVILWYWRDDRGRSDRTAGLNRVRRPLFRAIRWTLLLAVVLVALGLALGGLGPGD